MNTDYHTKYLKYKKKYLDLKQKGSGNINEISNEDYKKILGIKTIYSPFKYSNFTYDYAISNFFIKIFNDSMPKSEIEGSNKVIDLGGGTCIDSIRYFIETIEKARIIRRWLAESTSAQAQKYKGANLVYKKLILNYLLSILNSNKYENMGILAKNLMDKKIITNDNEITDSCNKIRNRFVNHHATVKNVDITAADTTNLNSILGENPNQRMDKVELYYGFYIGLLICILHSGLDVMYIRSEDSHKDNKSLTTFFENARAEEVTLFVNHYKKENLETNKIREKINDDFNMGIPGKIRNDFPDLRQYGKIPDKIDLNKFKIPEEYPIELIDDDGPKDSRKEKEKKQNIAMNLNLDENRKYQFTFIMYLALTDFNIYN